MDLRLQIDLLVMIVLAAILSGIIGMDRERRDKSAGLRTHMLAGVGACLFTIIGMYAFPQADQSRVAASVVSGIGFLGGGVIFRGENRVRDLTTAASVWATAGIGMAAAVGAWFLAIASTLLIWLVLAVLHGLGERVINHSS